MEYFAGIDSLDRPLCKNPSSRLATLMGCMSAIARLRIPSWSEPEPAEELPSSTPSTLIRSRVLRPDEAPRLITTHEQKVELLEKVGIDVLIVEDFDAEVRSSTTAEAVHTRDLVYANSDRWKSMWVTTFHFGRDREGSMRLLTELGPKLGFSVTIVPEVRIEGSELNSTRIRKLLAGIARRGSRPDAGPRIQHPRPVSWRAIREAAQWDFQPPTSILKTRFCPLPVSTRVVFFFIDEGAPERGVELPAVMNVGTRPTFEGDGRMQAEAHLIDFEGDVYGRRVEMSFLSRLREERKFSGAEALREQIASDVGADSQDPGSPLSTDEQSPPRASSRRWSRARDYRVWVSLAITAVFIWFVVRDVDICAGR